MNCVWPKAPAQDPTSRSGAMCSSWMIFRVAKNSPRKYACRRPKHDSVDKDVNKGRPPSVRPKLLSTPHTAAMVAGSTL
ncbi:hypothetical protein D3C72_1330110 [compost metagenome]